MKTANFLIGKRRVINHGHSRDWSHRLYDGKYKAFKIITIVLNKSKGNRYFKLLIYIWFLNNIHSYYM